MERLRRFVVDVAGPDRTRRRNLQLAAVLAFTAGALNSVGFVAVSVYTSHMTGLTAALAEHVVLGDRLLILTPLVGLTCFVAGAATCAVVFNWGRRRGRRGLYANVLALEALLVLLFSLLADRLTWGHREFVFIGVLCFTMGMQNAVITKISRAEIRTTHVTGMITDLGIELGKWLYRPRHPELGTVSADRSKAQAFLVLVGLFIVGGSLGTLGFLQFGFATLLPLGLCLLILTAAPLTADLRVATAHRRSST